MADESDDSDGDEGADTENENLVVSINHVLLDMIGETVKLSIVLAELSPEQITGVRARWNAFVAAVSAVKLKSPPKKKTHLV
jgi:hypothetical protein